MTTLYFEKLKVRDNFLLVIDDRIQKETHSLLMTSMIIFKMGVALSLCNILMIWLSKAKQYL